jgi:Spy/CpxP family protein refolding chaperone
MRGLRVARSRTKGSESIHMKIKMQVLALGAAVLLCGAGAAVPAAMAQDAPSGQQGPPPGGPRGGMDPATRAAQLQKQLTLTDEVTAQVKTILTDSSAKIQALRANGGSREDMMAIRTDESAKIKALLTPDQATKYDEIQAEMRARRGQGGPPPQQ